MNGNAYDVGDLSIDAYTKIRNNYIDHDITRHNNVLFIIYVCMCILNKPGADESCLKINFLKVLYNKKKRY